MSELEQFTVDVISIRKHGFGHNDNKVRVTDNVTGFFEECGEDRSQHRNCEVAKERLRARLKAVSGFEPNIVLKDDCEPTRDEIMELWESVLSDNTKNRSVRLIVLTFSFLLLKKARGE